jgi:hypothetical protein
VNPATAVVLIVEALAAFVFAWASWLLAHRPEPQGRVTSDGKRPR